jgi:hypothetical protein
VYLNFLHQGLTDAFVRKLSEKLRDAYAPLAEGCCKAIISTISLNVDELNSGTGNAFSGVLRSLTDKMTAMLQMLMFAHSHS